MKTALERASPTRVASIVLALSLTAAVVPSGKPQDAGLSSERLQRINEVVQRYVESGQISEAVTMVSRRGRVAHFEAQGLMDIATSTLFSGGGGLWSTAQDYMQFAQMLVNGGVLNGKRLLSPRTVDLMASNHVRDLYGVSQRLQGMGFGLTVEVVLDSVAAGRRQSNGSFGWDGALGTHFWVDRKEQLVGLLMIQEPVAAMGRDFENAVMQAIVE